MANEFSRVDRESYSEMRGELPGYIERDLERIWQNSRKYPDIFPRMRNLIYDSYLKSHGISEGLRSYNKVVMMVSAARDEENGQN